MIKTVGSFLFLSLLGVFIQGSLFPKLLFFSAAPDFILILVVWVSLTYEDAAALLGSFLLGLLSDFASGIYIGPQAAGALLACVLIRAISKHVYADRFASVITVVILASIAKQAVARTIVLAFIGLQALDELGIGTFFFQAIFTGLIAPFVLRFALSKRKRKVRA